MARKKPWNANCANSASPSSSSIRQPFFFSDNHDNIIDNHNNFSLININ